MKTLLFLLVSIFMLSCETPSEAVSTTSSETYIVMFDMGVQSLQQEYGYTVTNKITAVFNGEVITNISNENLTRLKSDPRVCSIVEDFQVTLPEMPVQVRQSPDLQARPPKNTQKTGWGVTMVGGAVDASTSEKLAWIVDSGIDTDHPDLNVYTPYGKNFVVGKTTFEDERGHGTHVAGIVGAKNNSIGVVGVAAGVYVVPIRVLNEGGTGYFSWFIQAFDYIATLADSGDVVNFSIGSSTRYTNDIFETSIKRLCDLGVSVFLAAGNQADDCQYYTPARLDYPNCYTIAGNTASKIWYHASNYGAPVDWIMPAEFVTSTYLNGSYASMSGTSMAAPHAAGVVLTGTIVAGGTVTSVPAGTTTFYGKRL